MPTPAGTAAADVVRVDFGGCMVRLSDGSIARARVRGKLMGRRKALGNAVVVGDRVVVDRIEPGAAEEVEVVVSEVEPRRNAFSRRAAGKQASEQVVASNLEQIVHVTACAHPAFSPGLADRILCQAEHAGIPARLVLNKRDLAVGAPGADAPDAILADYARAGYPGHAVSSLTGEGISELLGACRERRSLFVGHSGVGKSTLLNALAPGLGLLSNQVNPKTGRGRHTTSAAWMVCPAPGLELVDTPGVRAFGLWGVGPDDLERSYPEFRPFLGACRFTDCTHDAEPGCAVREAVSQGRIAARRHASFLKLRAELLQDAPWESSRAVEPR